MKIQESFFQHGTFISDIYILKVQYFWPILTIVIQRENQQNKFHEVESHKEDDSTEQQNNILL